MFSFLFKRFSGGQLLALLTRFFGPFQCFGLILAFALTGKTSSIGSGAIGMLLGMCFFSFLSGSWFPSVPLVHPSRVLTFSFIPLPFEKLGKPAMIIATRPNDGFQHLLMLLLTLLSDFYPSIAQSTISFGIPRCNNTFCSFLELRQFIILTTPSGFLVHTTSISLSYHATPSAPAPFLPRHRSGQRLSPIHVACRLSTSIYKMNDVGIFWCCVLLDFSTITVDPSASSF